jgi:hypothetical protein
MAEMNLRDRNITKEEVSQAIRNSPPGEHKGKTTEIRCVLSGGRELVVRILRDHNPTTVVAVIALS